MSAAHQDRCAYCVATLHANPCEAIETRADGSNWSRPIKGFDAAIAALAKGETVQHVSGGAKFGIWAVTAVGGTPVCETHAAWAVNAWAGV